ncbi:MAG: DUF6855 family protein [Devosia sp.]
MPSTPISIRRWAPEPIAGGATLKAQDGWCGIGKGRRGRFGNCVPPVLEALGLVEPEHHRRNNRVRAI